MTAGRAVQMDLPTELTEFTDGLNSKAVKRRGLVWFLNDLPGPVGVRVGRDRWARRAEDRPARPRFELAT